MGLGKNEKSVYIIDFGLSNHWRLASGVRSDERRKHDCASQLLAFCRLTLLLVMSVLLGELIDMLQSTHTLRKNNLEEMIWRPLVMCLSTSLKAVYLGRA